MKNVFLGVSDTQFKELTDFIPSAEDKKLATWCVEEIVCERIDSVNPSVPLLISQFLGYMNITNRYNQGRLSFKLAPLARQVYECLDLEYDEESIVTKRIEKFY